jgi:UDP-N-acetylglucosamine--N-acetylmuramyl-(pentapeptide) pyrophosphoryl-undecaprenol N-acetylglucosamine transferase
MPAAARLAVDAGVAIEIVQQVPSADPSALAATYRGMGVPARLAVRLEDMAAAYAHADVAVTRGGANTLAELAASALPAAVVPLADAAANHQQGYAVRWSASGAGPMVLEAPAAATPVAEWLVMMAGSRERWRAASAAARSLHQPGAAERLAEHCGTMARTTP